MSQVGILKYIADKWHVDIDGYSIPFPDLKLAQAYLNYIRLWQGEGEIISYDHTNKTLFWAKKDKVSVNLNPAKGHVCLRQHKARRNKDTKQADNARNHSHSDF